MPVDAARSPHRRSPSCGRALTVLVVAQFVLMLDTSVTNMALPTIGRKLSLADASLAWVTNAYIVAFGGFLLLGGALADGLGAKRLFVWGLAFFGGTSLAAGLAGTGTWLIAARLGQGLAAALLAPATLALLAATFAAGPARDRALGVWGVAGAAGAPAGGVLGGLLTGWLGWASVLLVNVPICALAAGAALLWLRTPAPAPPRRAGGARSRFDVAGAATVTSATAALLVAIMSVAEGGSGPRARGAVLFAGATLLLAAFVRIERRARRPLLPLWLIRRRPIAVAVAVAVLTQMAGYGMSFLLTLQLQRGFGLTPIRAGLAFLPFGAAAIVSSRAAPWVVRRVGTAHALALGAGSVCLGLVPMAQIPWDRGYAAFVVPALVLAGLGAGLLSVGVSQACIAAAPADRVGLAAAVITSAQQLGGAVGLAAVSSVAASVGGPAGFRAGYATAATLAGLAVVSAAALFPRAGRGPSPRTSPPGAPGPRFPPPSAAARGEPRRRRSG